MNKNKYIACLLTLISVCSSVPTINAGNSFSSTRIIYDKNDHKEIEKWSAGNKNDGFVKCTLNFQTGHLNVKATSQDKQTELKEIFIKGRELWKPYIKSVSFEGNFLSIGSYMDEKNSYEIKRTFENCNGITSIEILNRVKFINSKAFEGFNNLIYLNIEGFVENICGAAFKNCTQLTNVKGCVKNIWTTAFANCRSLQSINVQGSIDNIFGLAFANCRSLQSINVQGSIDRISGCAFANCNNLIDINIEGSVNNIDESAFFGCNSLPIGTKLKLYE